MKRDQHRPGGAPAATRAVMPTRGPVAATTEPAAFTQLLGNDAISRLLRGGKGSVTAPAGAVIADPSVAAAHEIERHVHNRAPAESAADEAGRRAETTPPEQAVALVQDAGHGGVLTEAGRRYFEPLVGGSLGGTRVHANDRAGRLADRAGAQALSYGRTVLLPGGTDLGSGRGRALLGHELAHVAQARPGPPRVHRKDKVEPHYPTEAEQHEIEKSLERDFPDAAPAAAPAAAAPPVATPPVATPPVAAPAAAAPAAAPPAPAPVRGRALDADARMALVARLKAPLFETLASMDPGAARAGGATVSGADAMASAERARAAIYDHFGDYITLRTVLTQDARATPDQRRAAGQVQVTFTAMPGLIHSTAFTVVQTHCKECSRELSTLDDASKTAVRRALIATALAERRDELQRITEQLVSGAYSENDEQIYLSLRSADAYGTAVHELIHRMAHPAFTAAFDDERNLIEGFTEYFTRQIVDTRTSYPEPVAEVTAAHAAAKAPFLFSQVSQASEESLRLAYFRGRLDLIGWRPSGPDEREAVEKAGGSAPWDPAVAQAKEKAYRIGYQADQAAHANVLGVGLYFPKVAGTDGRLAVRYARVFVHDEPYAKWRGLLDGQLIGPVIRDPKSLAASLGIAGEYQEPYFHLGAGVRLIGDLIGADGDRKINLMPFGFAGIRAWQRIQVGAEGFVLLPLAGHGQETALGVAATVGVEF